MNKHKLLREDILPAMASNRKVQRLLNEFMDLLSEYDSTETNSEPKNPPQPTAPSQPAKDVVDSNPPTVDKQDSDPAETSREHLVEPADHTLQATDEMDAVTTTTQPQADSVQNTPQATEQMDIDVPASGQVENPAPSPKEKDSWSRLKTKP